MFGQDNFICSTKCDWKSQKIMVGIAAVLCAVLLIFLWSNAGIIMRQRNLMFMNDSTDDWFGWYGLYGIYAGT